ncbi:MAG TPA: glycosyltransferase family 2 protein [Chloroflexota bacterium]|nr:glycosyltransferase family 2 protein [Chloroflexota bacterium]
MSTLVTTALTLAGLGLLLFAAYLLLITVAALAARRAAPPPGPAQRRFAILIPAHDEEQVIGRLLRSLRSLDYPNSSFDVCVVADNCSDATATIARRLGARVYERFHDVERAKGFALRWLLAELRAERRTYDAFIVLDADSVVESNLLRVLDARLEAGSQVIQTHYSVLNAHASAVAGLRYAALAAVHFLRPLGRSAFGLSCGLKGNGMCFATHILERFAWSWFSLAEDVEFHLALVRAGLRVDFAPETTVLADMPVSLAQAASQNQRWERGRLQLLRSHLPLLLEGLRLRSWRRIDAAIEQLMPPLSVPFALAGVVLVGSLVVAAWPAALFATIAVLAQLAYLAAGLLLVRAPLKAYLALSSAPLYIAWKVGLYARSLINVRATAWIRTARVTPR